MNEESKVKGEASTADDGFVEDDRKAELERKSVEEQKSQDEKGDETKEGEELPQEGEKDDGVTGECETGQLQDVEETAHLDAEEKDIQLQGETKLEEESPANEEDTGCQHDVKSQEEEKLQEEVAEGNAADMKDEIGDEDERVNAAAEAEQMISAVVEAAKEAARNKYSRMKTEKGDAAVASTELVAADNEELEVQEQVETAGVEAAKLEFARIKAEAAGIQAEDEVSKFKDRIEEEGLSAEIETVGRQAANEEYSRLRAAEVKLSKLICAVEESARRAANEMFQKLKESDDLKAAGDNSSLPGDTLSSLGRDNARKADVEKAGFEAAEMEYARLKAAEEETLTAFGPAGEEAWAKAEKQERQEVEAAGKRASQREYERLHSE